LAEHANKRRLRNLLLDGRLQLRYAIGVTGVCLAIALALGLLIYQQSIFASDQITTALEAPEMDWIGKATKAAVHRQLSHTDSSLVVTMVAIGLGLALVVVASLVAMTHRIAGPLYRMGRYFDNLRAGRLDAPGRLRGGDQFRQVFEQLCAAHETLHRRAQADLEAMTAFLEIAGDSDAAGELRALVDEKRRSL
jgi:hypothetical protein